MKRFAYIVFVLALASPAFAYDLRNIECQNAAAARSTRNKPRR
jgi:hypothetical protein